MRNTSCLCHFFFDPEYQKSKYQRPNPKSKGFALVPTLVLLVLPLMGSPNMSFQLFLLTESSFQSLAPIAVMKNP